MPIPAAVPLIAAGIAAGGSIWDSVSGQKTAKRNVDKTIAAQRAESQLSYERGLGAWHMQNAYNSPEAQMQRYKAAGLNPHLIYGQGSPGNAGGVQPYQPADIQYRYQAPTYGSAMQSSLPVLMQVGSWLQDMRLKDAALVKTRVETDRSVTETERARQMMDYLVERNPQLLREGQNRLSLFPYQKDAQRFNAGRSYMALADMDQEYRYKYGEPLFSELQRDAKLPSQGAQQGVRRLQFLEQDSKTRLSQARASWSEFDITDPQQIMMMVLNGVMGLAGQTLRLSTHRRPKTTRGVTEEMRGGRKRTRFTTRE